MRCKKSRLALRKPLWERAVEEKKLQEQPKKPKESSDDEDKASRKKKAKKATESDDEEANVKKKKVETVKPWWTMEWISTIQRGAGRYPIVCRVERAVAEFPYDQESQTEIRRFHYDANRAKSGGGKVARAQEKGREKPTRQKPPMCLAVTLKPLAPITPPTSCEGCEETLAPPPLFSVLNFPCENAPFLVPFAFAYRSSLMFRAQDPVKITEHDGTRHTAKFLSYEDTAESFETLSEAFGTIVKKYSDTDITAVQKLDSLIAEAYSKSNSDIPLPEADVRAAIQTVLYQIHTRKAKAMATSKKSAKEAQYSSQGRRLDPASLVSNIVSLIRMSLPRWNSVSIEVDADKKEQQVCPWQLICGTSDDNNDIQQGAITAALAPSILVSSTRVSYAGLVYTIDETLRSQLESVLNYLMVNDSQTVIFVPPVTELIAPEYSRFVPLAMCFRRILKRLKRQRLKYPKSASKNGEDILEDQGYGDDECCYYRSIGSLQSDISDIFQNCLLYNA